MAKRYTTAVSKSALGLMLASPLVLVGPAIAQEAGSPSPYAKCAEIADDTMRLACFDETLAGEATRIAEERAAREQKAEEEFGLTPAQVRARAEAAGKNVSDDGSTVAAARSDDGEEGISASISQVSSNARGDYVLRLDNGQTWRSTSNSNMRRRPRAGGAVTIEQIWSGGYRLKIEGRRGYLGVIRIR